MKPSGPPFRSSPPSGSCFPAGESAVDAAGGGGAEWGSWTPLRGWPESLPWGRAEGRPPEWPEGPAGTSCCLRS